MIVKLNKIALQNEEYQNYLNEFYQYEIIHGGITALAVVEKKNESLV